MQNPAKWGLQIYTPFSPIRMPSGLKMGRRSLRAQIVKQSIYDFGPEGPPTHYNSGQRRGGGEGRRLGGAFTTSLRISGVRGRKRSPGKASFHNCKRVQMGHLAYCPLSYFYCASGIFFCTKSLRPLVWVPLCVPVSFLCVSSRICETESRSSIICPRLWHLES